MKGGFNKILRNIVAGSSDTEFEKVSRFPCTAFNYFSMSSACRD